MRKTIKKYEGENEEDVKMNKLVVEAHEHWHSFHEFDKDIDLYL